LISLTKDLTPKDNKESPLRELDWQDDDYAMEVVSGKLHDKDIDYIFEDLRRLNQRGDTNYFPSMAESGERCIKVIVPPEYLLLIDQVARKYSNLDISDALRICLLHGLSIYEQKYGYDIEKLYDTSVSSQAAGAGDSVMVYNTKVCSGITGARYSLRVEGRLFKILNQWSTHAGCTQHTFAGICILYSIRSHTRLRVWVPKINRSLDQFEESIQHRISLLGKYNV
jgi:hypothetical protein